VAVEAEHSQDRAGLDRDLVGLDRVFSVAVLTDVQRARQDEQVPGRADREELGESLDQPEEDRLK
jgi:hypothetical protein